MFLLVGGPQHSYKKALDVKVSMEWCGPPDGKGGVQEVVRAQWGPDGEDPWLGVTLAGRLYEGPPGVHGGPRHLLVVGVVVAETLPLLPHVQARHVRYGQAAGPPQAGEATWTSDIDRGELWGAVNTQLSHTINTEIQFSLRRVFIQYFSPKPQSPAWMYLWLTVDEDMYNSALHRAKLRRWNWTIGHYLAL